MLFPNAFVGAKDKKRDFMLNFPAIIPSPWLIPEVISFLDRYLTGLQDPKILEFGSGCSTAFFVKYLGVSGELTSIEHNQAWHGHVCAYLEQNSLNKQVDLRFVQDNCAQVCQQFAANSFDLVFIDAKDRMACLQAAREIVKPGGMVMLDDSQMRDKYQIANQIMADWPKSELVGVKSNPLDLTAPEQISATAWWIKPAM